MGAAAQRGAAAKSTAVNDTVGFTHLGAVLIVLKGKHFPDILLSKGGCTVLTKVNA